MIEDFFKDFIFKSGTWNYLGIKLILSFFFPSIHPYTIFIPNIASTLIEIIETRSRSLITLAHKRNEPRRIRSEARKGEKRSKNSKIGYPRLHVSDYQSRYRYYSSRKHRHITVR